MEKPQHEFRQGDRVLRKAEPHANTMGMPCVPFTDEGDVLTANLDDGRVLVRWRLSRRNSFEKVENLVLWTAQTK